MAEHDPAFVPADGLPATAGKAERAYGPEDL